MKNSEENMNKTLLKNNKPSLNTYEGVYDILSNKPGFDKELWTMSANSGNLDVYASALNKLEKDGVNYKKIYDEMHLEFADPQLRLTALYNEAFGDRTNNEKRETVTYDSVGNPVVSHYESSDYDYTKNLIKFKTQNIYETRVNELQQELKDDAGVFEKILDTAIATGGGFLKGFVEGTDNLLALNQAIVENVMQPWDYSDKKVVETLSNRELDFVVDTISNWERENLSVVDTLGNPTGLSRYLVGASNSMGMMVPSMLIGKGFGLLGKAAGVSGKALGTATTIASQGSFYGGMAAGNVKDSYVQFQEMGADIDHSAILANATIKSAFQWGVEKALGTFLGSTAVDDLVFGTSQKSLSKIGLTKSGVLRILKDAGQEGLEEVLQDTSDFLVNQAFDDYIDGFSSSDDISFQSLFDAFVIGAFMSLAGSATSVLKSNTIYQGDKKLNKIASWEYGINAESFVKNVDEVLELISKPSSKNIFGEDKIKVAALEAYSSYRVITSIYKEIGDARFKAANQVLDRITADIKSGRYESNGYEKYVNQMREQMSHLSNLAFLDAIKELRKKNVKEVKNVVKKNDVSKTESDLTTSKNGESTDTSAKEKLEKLLSNTNVDSVTLVDGDVELLIDNNIVVSESRLNKESLNQIMINVSIQRLTNGINDLLVKEKMLDNFVEKYKVYSGDDNGTSKQTVAALLFDRNFITSVLLDGNKDVYKIFSYFLQAEKDLVKGKLRDDIYHTKIDEIREHWLTVLSDYCMIHPEANPRDFLDFVKDKKKVSEIEKKIKRGRWSKNVYNRVIKSNKNLSLLADSEKEVLKKRFYSAFSKSTADRHWKNINSEDASVKMQSMNALSMKFNNLFNNQYDGKTYMPDISIANRVFNKFLKGYNLNLANVLDSKHLTKSDLANLKGQELTRTNILKFRQEQFNRVTHGSYTFQVSKDNVFKILYKGEIVGYSKYNEDVESIISGEKSDTSVTGSFSRHKGLKTLLRKDLVTNFNYYKIDDVITEPDILNDETKRKIIKFANDRYGIKISYPDSQMTMLYLRDYFISEYKTITITVNHDGEYVFADVEKVEKLFVKSDVKINKDSKLKDIFNERYIPDGLKLVIVPDSSDCLFVPYKNEKIGDSVAVTIDNTIYIGEKIFDESQDYVRFVYAHEFQHAIQFANNLNFGLSFKWLSMASKSVQSEIIKDVRSHKQELFVNVEKGSAEEFNIVQDYVYHSSAEYQAYGLEGNNVIDFVPFVSRNVNNVLSIYAPWGKKYSITGVGKITDVSNSIIKKIAENLYSFTELKDLNDNINMNPLISDWRIQKNVRVYNQSSSILAMLRNEKDKQYNDRYRKLIAMQQNSVNSILFNTWKNLPMNTPSAKSEKFKQYLKDNLTDDDKMVSQHLMHLLLAPDMDFSEFLNTEVNFVRMQKRGHLGESPFVSIYAGATEDSVRFCLESFYKISSHPKDALDTYIIVGTFKPKDAMMYFGTKESEVLIEPSKLAGSKIYRALSVIDYEEVYPYQNTILKTKDGDVVFNPYLHISSTDDHYIVDGMTGQVYLESTSVDELLENDFRIYGFNDLSPETIENIYLHGLDDNLISQGEEITALKIQGVNESFEGDTLDLKTRKFRHLHFLFQTRITTPDGNVITPEETQTSLANLELMYGMSLKPKKTIGENDKSAKNFIITHSNKDVKYKERRYVLNADGTQRLNKQGKPIYKYVYEKKGSRYVGKRKYKGTNLEYFTRSYSPTQMTPEMQKFILSAKDLDPWLQDRINGDLRGTLTQNDVMDFLREKEKIDDNTFRQINEAFFQNEFIKTFDELRNHIDYRMRESWAMYRVFKISDELEKEKKLLSESVIDFEWLQDLVVENPKYSKIYVQFLSEFDEYHGTSFDINESYARIRYMRKYDGTIKSERDVASIVRLIGLLGFNTTHKGQRLLNETYAEVLEGLDLSDDEIIEFISSREFTKKAKDLANTEMSYENAKMELLKYKMELEDSLRSLSHEELVKRYKDENGLNHAVIEGILSDTSGKYQTIPDSTPVITSRHIVNRINGFIRTIKRNLNGKEINSLVKENSDIFEKDLKLKKSCYQNEILNKTRDDVHYVYKDVSELQSLLERISEIKSDAIQGYISNKTSKAIRDKEISELNKRIKTLEKETKNQKSTEIPKVVEIVTDEGSFNIHTNKEIPYPLMKILQVHYNKTAKSSIANLSSENKHHVKMVSKTFLEENADNFQNLTQGDVDSIIDFYLTTDVPFNEATTPYQLAEIWILTYLTKMGRKGSANFVISFEQLSKIEDLLDKILRRSATNLVTWRSALKELEPEQIIVQAIARKTGVEISDDDVDDLINAIQTRDVSNIKKVKSQIYEKILAKERDKGKKGKRLDDALYKILQWERLAMLSGPGTWARNWTSNLVVAGVNRASDGMNGKLDSVLSKLFPKSQLVEDQYRIAGTKVRDDVRDYINANLINNKLLDEIMSSISKYDTRVSLKGKEDATVLAKIIADNIVTDLKRDRLFNDKYASKVENFIIKAISDNLFVKNTAKRYLGKMLTEDLENGKIIKSETLTENGISKQFMTYVAESFKMASYDYMHRSNFLYKLESELAHKNVGAYFMYKQVFPFAGASWNWFVEGLKYTPLGLAKSIYNYAKLEKTVEGFENRRQKFANNDTGVSSRFAKYLTLRDVNKGVIGSVGLLIGILLRSFGVAGLDEEDDKYKLTVGNAKIDVSEIFGTQGIFLGLAITDSILRDNVDPMDVISATLDQLFIDSTFADFFNTFRYSESFGDWLAYQPTSMVNMMIPNFLKTITSINTPHKVQYSDGIIGRVERLAVTSIPALHYLFPVYHDPYTGEKQVSSKLWFLTKFVDKLSPVGLSVYNISDEERLLIKHGINKSQLTGRYEVNDDKVSLNPKQVEKINSYYGQLNAQSIKELKSDSKTYKIKQSNGTFKNLRWSQMTDKEKATVIDRIMTNNSGYAKIYILTQDYNYKYYASDSEYQILRQLGITKNVYRQNKKFYGFVKN